MSRFSARFIVLLSVLVGTFVPCTQAQSSPEPLMTLQMPAATAGAAWSPDESRILAWSFDGSIRIFDASSGALQLALDKEGYTTKAAWNADGTRILALSDLGDMLRVWDTSSGEEYFLSGPVWPSAAVWSRDGNRILSQKSIPAKGGVVSVWDTNTGEETASMSFQTDSAYTITTAVWSADESRVIISWRTSDTNLVEVWDIARDIRLFSLPHDTLVRGANWNPDETRIATWGDDGVRIWDAASGELLHLLSCPSTVQNVVWRSDGKRLLALDFDMVYVWDTESATELLRLPHTWAVLGANWNADESLILSHNIPHVTCEADCYHEIHVWDAESGEVLVTLRHDAERAGAGQRSDGGASWSPDERYILTWARTYATYGDVRVWDAKSGEEILRLPHQAWVLGATWNAQGDRILTWTWTQTHEGRVHVWDISD